MQIHRSATVPGRQAPESTFTGLVTVAGYFRRDPPSRLAGATVAFAPGARTPWKTNPLGQTLVVLEGVGRAQQEGGKVVELRAGDVVWFPPGVRHWEGAGFDAAMTCVALQETDGGTGVAFAERVSDETYREGRAAG